MTPLLLYALTMLTIPTAIWTLVLLLAVTDGRCWHPLRKETP